MIVIYYWCRAHPWGLLCLKGLGRSRRQLQRQKLVMLLIWIQHAINGPYVPLRRVQTRKKRLIRNEKNKERTTANNNSVSTRRIERPAPLTSAITESTIGGSVAAKVSAIRRAGILSIACGSGTLSSSPVFIFRECKWDTGATAERCRLSKSMCRLKRNSIGRRPTCREIHR